MDDSENHRAQSNQFVDVEQESVVGFPDIAQPEAEGVVFSDLLRDIRQRLAQKYLRESYSVEQITYLLGFSEPSVFRKSFKKWLGITPGEYRQGTLA